MSVTLFFLVPIGMLAVAWSLCFVGCALQTHGEGEPSPYSTNILAEESLVAYWPLGDLPGATVAVDLSGHDHNGTYTIPPAYPQGTTFLNNATPTLNLQQPSIVPGDFGGPDSGNQNLAPACVDFEGGYVSIPWAPNSPTLTDFTLEAWVEPLWPQSETGFQWVVFGALSNNFTGFALYINEQNQWAIAIGNGAALQQFNTSVPVVLPDPKATPPIPAKPTYVAVTFKSAGQMLSLWINPESPPPAWPPASPPPSAVNYVAIDPMQPPPLTFFIGAGGNLDAQNLRTVNGGPGAPTNPYQGFIQSVALYQSALDPTDLAAHFLNGVANNSG